MLACAAPALAATNPAVAVSDTQVEDRVRRSYQYVAMYNVNNKFVRKQGGWNSCVADAQLKDHTMRDIARPNNDTLYISCMLDLRNDPMILEMPAFDSKYLADDHRLRPLGEHPDVDAAGGFPQVGEDGDLQRADGRVQWRAARRIFEG